MANNCGNIDQLKAKRRRSANWDTLEKVRRNFNEEDQFLTGSQFVIELLHIILQNLLKSCMKEFVSILENKNTDTNTNRSKNTAWQTVTKRFVKYHVFMHFVLCFLCSKHDRDKLFQV